MATNKQQQQNAVMVADFINTEANAFHDVFGSPSKRNMGMAQYKRPEVVDLQETLYNHQHRARKYVDFIHDLTQCSWDHVHEELRKAQEAAIQSEERGKNIIKRVWRRIGVTSSILAPGLAAIPDELCILNGGLAVIFSLARHSEMNRNRILAAFENVPNIIEMARNKAENLPVDGANPKSVHLHKSIQELQTTLLETLPALIDKLIPGTFRNAWKSPFAGCKIGQLLDAVSVSADRVRVCAESLLEEIIVDNYAASMAIKSQLDEVLRQQRMMQISINAAHGQTHLLNFLMEQLNVNHIRTLGDGDQTDLSERGTALPGFTPEDILMILDINHLRITSDSRAVMRKGKSMTQADIECAACMMTEPQVKQLLDSNASSSVVSVDGHFDRTQMGKISPLSYICTLLSYMMRQIPQPPALSFSQNSPMSPLPHERAAGNVVLEYFCALHTSDGDNLRGPQGLLRCLSMQLILSMVANRWISESNALPLPHLRDGEEDLLAQQDHGAICRLFASLIRLAPEDASIYCIIDGWSAYEREELWQVDCDTALDAFRNAMNIQSSQGGAAFKLLLTSPTISRSLEGFVRPDQRVSLRGRDGREGRWRGTGRGGLIGLARVATMPDSSTE